MLKSLHAIGRSMAERERIPLLEAVICYTVGGDSGLIWETIMTDGENTLPPPPVPPPPVPPKRGNTQDEVVATVIPYRNPMALAAYYLGIFSFIPVLGIFLGAAAFICGILGLRHASTNKGAHGRAHAAIGIGCGGFFFLLYTVGGLAGLIIVVLNTLPEVWD